MSAGNVKRDRIMKVKEGLVERGEPVDEAMIAERLPEQEVSSYFFVKSMNFILFGLKGKFPSSFLL